MKKIIIFIDGGSKNNPGPAALGAIFCNEKGEIFKKYSQYLGDKLTNNQAEYLAFIFALKKLKSLFGKKLAWQTEIEVNSDSELLIRQLRGEYKILEPEIQKLFLEAWNLKVEFKKLKLKLIPRQKNQEADKLVREILDSKIQKIIP